MSSPLIDLSRALAQQTVHQGIIINIIIIFVFVFVSVSTNLLFVGSPVSQSDSELTTSLPRQTSGWNDMSHIKLRHLVASAVFDRSAVERVETD